MADGLIGKALEYPLSSLEGVAFLEILIILVLIFGCGIIVLVVRRLFKKIDDNAKEARESRGKIYTFTRDEMAKLRDEIKEQGEKQAAALKEQGEKQAAALRDHEETCGLYRQKDERWKGQIEGKLGISTEA